MAAKAKADAAAHLPVASRPPSPRPPLSLSAPPTASVSSTFPAVADGLPAARPVAVGACFGSVRVRLKLPPRRPRTDSRDGNLCLLGSAWGRCRSACRGHRRARSGSPLARCGRVPRGGPERKNSGACRFACEEEEWAKSAVKTAAPRACGGHFCAHAVAPWRGTRRTSPGQPACRRWSRRPHAAAIQPMRHRRHACMRIDPGWAAGVCSAFAMRARRWRRLVHAGARSCARLAELHRYTRASTAPPASCTRPSVHPKSTVSCAIDTCTSQVRVPECKTSSGALLAIRAPPRCKFPGRVNINLLDSCSGCHAARSRAVRMHSVARRARNQVDGDSLRGAAATPSPGRWASLPGAAEAADGSGQQGSSANATVTRPYFAVQPRAYEALATGSRSTSVRGSMSMHSGTLAIEPRSLPVAT